MQLLAVSLRALVIIAADGGNTATAQQADAPPAVSKSCTTAECHPGIQQRPHLHQPVAAHRCGFCHEPRAGATPYHAGVRHEFVRAGDNAELCYRCHDRLAVMPHVHEPVKMGLCVLCHDPHGAEGPALLRHHIDRDLCFQCHRDTFTHGENVHGPLRVGACGACHDPHQSANRFRLRGVGTAQCGMCHLTDIREILGASRIHEPVAEKCSNCHEPHSSPNQLRLTQSPPRLCLDCHENVDMQLHGAVSVHQPAAEGKCGSCHEHHAGDFRALLRAPFTPEPYEAFSVRQFELCYRCHAQEQVTEPATMTATDFRNGEVNLHFKHVNQEEKGRTCNMCHEVHASASTHLLRREIPFGEWELPLDYQGTVSGGTCLVSCHRARGYDRMDAVQNK